MADSVRLPAKPEGQPWQVPRPPPEAPPTQGLLLPGQVGAGPGLEPMNPGCPCRVQVLPHPAPPDTQVWELSHGF